MTVHWSIRKQDRWLIWLMSPALVCCVALMLSPTRAIQDAGKSCDANGICRQSYSVCTFGSACYAPHVVAHYTYGPHTFSPHTLSSKSSSQTQLARSPEATILANGQ